MWPWFNSFWVGIRLGHRNTNPTIVDDTERYGVEHSKLWRRSCIANILVHFCNSRTNTDVELVAKNYLPPLYDTDRKIRLCSLGLGNCLLGSLSLIFSTALLHSTKVWCHFHTLNLGVYLRTFINIIISFQSLSLGDNLPLLWIYSVIIGMLTLPRYQTIRIL